MKKNNTYRKGVTFVELLVVFSLVTVLAVTAIALINPKKQLEKAWDAQKKRDVYAMGRSFEEYYNDNGVYPGSKACDDSPLTLDDMCTCHICQFKNIGLPTYLKSAVCNFQNAAQKYLYLYDCVTPTKPTWYEICGTLNNPDNKDQIIASRYNFGISSPNKKFTYCLSGCMADDSQFKYCFKTSSGNPICNGCGTTEECYLLNRCDSPITLYKNSDCTTTCEGVLE